MKGLKKLGLVGLLFLFFVALCFSYGGSAYCEMRSTWKQIDATCKQMPAMEFQKDNTLKQTYNGRSCMNCMACVSRPYKVKYNGTTIILCKKCHFQYKMDDERWLEEKFGCLAE
ncbi:MAG: hypothetical protein WCJ46_04960 [bacterium]